MHGFGATVAPSISFDDAFEIVQFNSWFADMYTIKAGKFRCDMRTWLGWAWHTPLMFIKMLPGP